jgi:putative membrane protein
MEGTLTGQTVPTWVTVLSITVFAVVVFLLVGPRPAGVAGSIDVSALPWVNAGINTVTAGLLLAGFAAIRAKRVQLHRWLMTSALLASATFLVSYVTYHWFSVGPTRYTGSFRALYLGILLSHVVLATVILPLALTTWYRGWTGRVVDHRRVAPRTLALWLYVALTGVLITVMAHG